MTCTKLNTKLLAPKLHYFLTGAGLAAFWPYIAVFGGQLGVPEVGIGLIFSVAPAIGMIANPIFGAIADHYKAKKKLFLIFNVVMLIFLSGFHFLPQTQIIRPVSLECEHINNSTQYKYSSYISYQSDRGPTQCNSNFDVGNPTNFNKNYSVTSTIEICSLQCILDPQETTDFCVTYFKTRKPRFCSAGEMSTVIDLGVELNTNPIRSVDLSTVYFQLTDMEMHEDDSIEPVEMLNSCGNLARFSNCWIDCDENPSLNRRFEHLQVTVKEEEFLKSRIFWMYSTLIIICWIAFTVVNSVGDTLTFQTLGDKSYLYGQQRQWGSVGWGTVSLLSGYLIDYFSKDSLLKDYTSSFYILFILLTLNLVVCYMWKVEEQEKPESLTKNMVGLILNPKIFVFILSCIVVGFCTGLLWQFIFWYAESLASCEQKKWIKVLQGLINFVQCFGGELPFFYLSSWFIRKLGHVHCMTLVLGAFGCRFLLYSVLTNPWTILPVELFQGITFGIFWTTMASYAYVVSPDGSAATVQGLVSAAFKGIGVGGGSLVGGILFKMLSGRMAFRIFGFVSLACCVLHFVVMKFLHRNFTPVSQDSEIGSKVDDKLEQTVTLPKDKDQS